MGSGVAGFPEGVAVVKVRMVALALAAMSVFGACQQEGEKKSGGTVKPAASSDSTAPTTATTANPTTTTAKPTTTTTEKATTTTTRVVTTTTGAASVSYANCDAVRAAGKAPLYRGEPGYSSKLDRDSDGVACE